MEIRRVLERKDGIKYLIIPKRSDINPGDHVGIVKINQTEVEKNVRGKKG